MSQKTQLINKKEHKSSLLSDYKEQAAKCALVVRMDGEVNGFELLYALHVQVS